MRLPLRGRFTLLAALLVLLVATLVSLVGYLALRHSLLAQADRQARTNARQLAALVDVPSGGGGAAGNRVDVTDPALTHELSAPGLVVEINRSGGGLIQASTGTGTSPPALPAGLLSRCMSAGEARQRLGHPALALACSRVGPRQAPVATVSVGTPLDSSFASLRTLRNALVLAVLGGALVAALLALLVARHAMRPVRQIAHAAETIRSGNLSERIGYRGRDELGALAQVLDACFDRIEQVLDRQRRFVADASHELKTPLAAIRANSDLLRGWAVNDPSARDDALASLDQAGRRASRLVADLLYLARLEHEPDRAKEAIRLDETVLSSVREATQLSPEVEIRVARLDEATVNGDSVGLQQLLLNLLDNGTRVSPPASAVTVALRTADGHATVTVSDSGPGIPPGQLERIFDRFYSRSDDPASRARNGSGAGLGLPIALAIAQDHGGTLTAQNQSGGGARFQLVLPLAFPTARGDNLPRQHTEPSRRAIRGRASGGPTATRSLGRRGESPQQSA